MQLTGILLTATSLALYMVERLSHVLSNLLGKNICSDAYMRPVDGVIGDASCGFNMDRYLSTGLIISFVLGVLLFIASTRKT
jgi:hypothetical protein